ncbi:MAG: hypothetical protein HY033_04355 [Ignavibacteriae bacterium]|nr:hypothetical protein [Ignavibacteria bacterium]MBI3364120.1 hypothetical protein [Ignavibacteriota bacterium]
MDVKNSSNVWLVAADMGYGHLRAVYPLMHFAKGGMITAGVDDGASEAEQRLWSWVMRIYAAFSRASSVPLIGRQLFSLLDRIQRIPPNISGRNLSEPAFQISLLERLISQGLCSGILEKINTNRLPLVTSFYAPAIAADLAGYNPVYCIICDAEIHRVWVARSPKQSRIVYFVPCERAAERLLAYGVPSEKILLIGFPLPHELLGGQNLSTLQSDFGQRLLHLDPNRIVLTEHQALIEERIGRESLAVKNARPLTITYAVGGAGAQKEIGEKIARSLAGKLADGSVKLSLVAGLHATARDFFNAVKSTIAPHSNNIEIVYGKTFNEYVHHFNNILHETDILWTKPSELSFYSALGIPIIMSPPLGSQEDYNRRWLLEIGAGIDQQNPLHTDRWLFEMITSGELAKAALAGYSKVRKLGTYAIADVIANGTVSAEESLPPPLPSVET